jgi:anti-anti-sigma factor
MSDDVQRPPGSVGRRPRSLRPDPATDGTSPSLPGVVSPEDTDALLGIPSPNRPCFDIQVRPERDCVFVELSGQLDIAVIDQVRACCFELLGAGFRHIVLDLRQLDFLDSTGLSLALELHAAARSDGWTLSLIPGPDGIQKVFAVSGVLDALPFTSASALRETRT